MKELITELKDKEIIRHKKERKVTIPSSVITIKKTTFNQDKTLIKVSIPKSVQILESGSFKDCINLKDVRFAYESRVRIIPKECFKNCSSLKQINIPSSMVTIEERAFENCTNLEKIEIPKTVVDVKIDAFAGFKNTQTITTYKEFEFGASCEAKVNLVKSDQEEDVIEKDAKGLYKFEVVCKCGHIGRAHYIPISFPVKAFTKKEASDIAKKIPRVKRDHSNVICSIQKIGNKRYKELKELNKEDIYLTVTGKKDLKERNIETEYKEEIERRRLPEEFYDQKFKRNKFKNKKNI